MRHKATRSCYGLGLTQYVQYVQIFPALLVTGVIQQAELVSHLHVEMTYQGPE